jgi:hypothetical protein
MQTYEIWNYYLCLPKKLMTSALEYALYMYVVNCTLLEIFDKIFYILNVCVWLHKIVLLQKRNIHYYCFLWNTKLIFFANTSVLVQLCQKNSFLCKVFSREKKTSLICWKVTNAFIFVKEVEISKNVFLK